MIKESRRRVRAKLWWVLNKNNVKGIDCLKLFEELVEDYHQAKGIPTICVKCDTFNSLHATTCDNCGAPIQQPSANSNYRKREGSKSITSVWELFQRSVTEAI